MSKLLARDSNWVSNISNCLINPRRDKENNSETLFSFNDDGLCKVNLEGYAIIPMEDYNALIGVEHGRTTGNTWQSRQASRGRV